MDFFVTFFALGFMIFIHEMGHLLAAKRSGVGVIEFSVGMGPKLLSRAFGETEYSLRLLPFGGFVRLAGMDDEDVPDEQNYYKKPLSARFLTISAGALVNIFFGYLIFLLAYMLIGVPSPSSVIETVLPDTPAAAAGLLDGDQVISINGNTIEHVGDDVIRVIQGSDGQSVELGLLRNGVEMNVAVVPEMLAPDRDVALIGVQFSEDLRRYSVFSSVSMASSASVDVIRNIFKSLKLLLTGQVSIKELSGPVGIVQFAAVGYESGLLRFLNIVAMISISLGVFNLLPFPVLDGGHLVFLAIEGILRRPISRVWEVRIHNVGAVMLLSLMAFVVVNDVLNWHERMDLFRSILK